MNLRSVIKKVLSEDTEAIKPVINLMLDRYIKERYPRFVCRIDVSSPKEDSSRIIVELVEKKLPDGDWVARDYINKALNECWDLINNFTGTPVIIRSIKDRFCGQTLNNRIDESIFLKRRANPETIESAITDALDYVSSKFYNKRSSWYKSDPEIFRRLVINVLMDHLHPKLSNWGTEDFPYDEVYNYLTDHYSQRILQRYKELDENPPTRMETNESEITERCWKGYTQKGMKTMFGKRYPNCVKKTKK